MVQLFAQCNTAGMGNGDVIRQLFQLFNDGQLDRLGEYVHDDIDWREPPETIGRSEVVGADAAHGALTNWVEQFDSLRAETVEVREEGDRVLHAMQQYATVRGSTAEVAGELYMVWWFRDGRASRMEMYNTRADAEAAFYRS